MPVTQVDCANVEDFEKAIRNYAAPRGVIFRGQENAGWHLEPSAFRSDSHFPTAGGPLTLAEWKVQQETILRAIPTPPGSDRVVIEHSALVLFFETADSAGLTLPEDTQSLRRALDAGAFVQDWPRPEVRSILALAQHNGIPTRLLDWTWDWKVAAYFAATPRDRAKRFPRLAVWSLNVDFFKIEIGLARFAREQGEGSGAAPKPYSVEIVTTPGATNGNLHAQKGISTLLTRPQGSAADLAKSLDELPPDDVHGDPVLTKVTLPTGEAPALLRRLAFEGVTAATLFPGFGGVARALQERALWTWQPLPLLVATPPPPDPAV